MTDIVERALTLDDADPEELAEMAEEPNPGSAETQTTGKAAKKKTAKTIKAVEPASDRAVSEGEGDIGNHRRALGRLAVPEVVQHPGHRPLG